MSRRSGLEEPLVPHGEAKQESHQTFPLETDLLRLVPPRKKKKHRNPRLRWLYMIAAGVLLLLFTPALLYSLVSQNSNARTFVLPLALVFCACAAPISLFGIYGHISNYWQPTLQKYVCRILWMVPIYSVTSIAELLLWLRVENGHTAAARWCVVPRAARDCYESYTVLNFLYFMLAFLEMSDGAPAEVVLKNLTASGDRIDDDEEEEEFSDDDDDDDEEDLDEGESEFTDERTPSSSSSSSLPSSIASIQAVRHPCPPYSCACSKWRLDNGEFLEKTRYGVLLYATLMPLCALALIANAIFESNDSGTSDDATSNVNEVVGDDNNFWNEVESILTPAKIAAFIQFNSANHAIYCLALFYYVAHGLLAPCHPHLKFVAVKGIVFGTFFQNLGIDALFYAKPSLARAFSGDDDALKTSAALGSIQSTLMCIEMFAFAVLHAKAFPVSEYPRVYKRRELLVTAPHGEAEEEVELESAVLSVDEEKRKEDDDILEEDDDEDSSEKDDEERGGGLPVVRSSSRQSDPERFFDRQRTLVRLDSDDDERTAHISDRSRAWLAAWGDFYAEQQLERQRNRERDLIAASRLIFDVSDVHHDTSATLSSLSRDVTDPILQSSSTSTVARALARLRNRPPNSVSFARFASQTAGHNPLV